MRFNSPPPGFGGGQISFGGELTPMIKKIMVINIAMFFIQSIAGHHSVLENWLALFSDRVFHSFNLWQLVSYQFLHGSIGHIFFNMLTLYFIGGEIERRLGENRFLGFYLLCGIIGGVASASFALIAGNLSVTMGASGAIFGLLAAYGLLYGERTIRVMLVFPVKAKIFVGILMLITLAMAIRQESNVDAICHLGGAAMAYCLVRLELKTNRTGAPNPLLDFLPNLISKWKKRQTSKAFEQSKNDKERMDTLLDKVSKDGLHNLTDKERTFMTDFSRRQANKH